MNIRLFLLAAGLLLCGAVAAAPGAAPAAGTTAPTATPPCMQGGMMGPCPANCPGMRENMPCKGGERMAGCPGMSKGAPCPCMSGGNMGHMAGNCPAMQAPAAGTKSGATGAEQVFGWQLMTPQERAAYQQKMRAAKTPKERATIRAEHHKEMLERAKQQGVTLPEVPPPRRG